MSNTNNFDGDAESNYYKHFDPYDGDDDGDSDTVEDTPICYVCYKKGSNTVLNLIDKEISGVDDEYLCDPCLRQAKLEGGY